MRLKKTEYKEELNYLEQQVQNQVTNLKQQEVEYHQNLMNLKEQSEFQEKILKNRIFLLEQQAAKQIKHYQNTMMTLKENQIYLRKALLKKNSQFFLKNKLLLSV